MNEKLLQFIWQHRYFQQTQLTTTVGASLHILSPGTLNSGQGPDFLAGIIQINQIKWVGNIELHVRSSDWHKHQHQRDSRYQQIILHVVWVDDQPLHDAYGNFVPTLVLGDKVAHSFLWKYQALMQSPNPLPCSDFLFAVNELIWISWKDRLVVERLLKRSNELLDQLSKATGNWNLMIWLLMAKTMGGKVNGQFFTDIIESVPYTIWLHSCHDRVQLEALLMGQGNLLNNNLIDTYPQILQREYKHLKTKHKLTPLKASAAFLRMRPAGFPTIRFSQLAALMNQQFLLLESILHIEQLPMYRSLFTGIAHPYWNNHYRFDEPSIVQPKIIGKHLQKSLVINVIVPILFAYGEKVKTDKWKEKALKLLYNMPPEQNRILTNWQQLAVANQCALHSQALLQLTQVYCAQKTCLSCAIGNAILKK